MYPCRHGGRRSLSKSIASEKERLLMSGQYNYSNNYSPNAIVQLNRIGVYYILNRYININYIYLYINCLCGSVAKASDTQAVGRGFEPRTDH